jgi:hypothetical protein
VRPLPPAQVNRFQCRLRAAVPALRRHQDSHQTHPRHQAEPAAPVPDTAASHHNTWPRRPSKIVYSRRWT